MSAWTLLPDNRTIHEDCLAVATGPGAPVTPVIEAARGFRYRRPIEATVAPYLVQEYGLGPIADFFAAAEDLIDTGRSWQRIRGTPAAVSAALGWIGYGEIVIEDQVANRRRWHLYQAGMGELPGVDEVNRLMSAEYLAGLSDPARSHFWRGHHGYDVRGHVWGRSRLGRSMLGDSSGVRIAGGRVKWSHGRVHEVSAVAEEGRAEALAVAYADGDPMTWSATLTWAAPGISWSGVTDARRLKSWLMRRKPAHVVFADASGEPIGYAAVLRAVRDVTDYEDGLDTVDLVYEVSAAFGAAVGDVSSVAIVFGGHSTANKPARPWLAPDEIDFPDGEIRVGASALAFSFQETVRERVIVNLTI